MSQKFGMIVHPLKDVIKESEQIAKHGLDYVEIAVEEPFNLPVSLYSRRSDFQKLIKEYGVFFVAHAPWNTEFGSSYDDVRNGWIDFSKEMIKISPDIGINKINFHAFTHLPQVKDDKVRRQTIGNCIESFGEIVKFAERKNVQIVLENLDGKEQLEKIDDIKEIVDNVKGLGVCCDIGHSFVTGGMNYIKNFLNTFSENLHHVHMHDNNGEGDEHLPLGKGSINFDMVARILKKINYNETITFEIFRSQNRKEEALNSMNFIRELLK